MEPQRGRKVNNIFETELLSELLIVYWVDGNNWTQGTAERTTRANILDNDNVIRETASKSQKTDKWQHVDTVKKLKF